MKFHWSGQSGQPSWLWGGNTSSDMYTYNPSNFSVKYANDAGTVGGKTVDEIIAMAKAGSGSETVAPGSKTYSTAGTYTWTVPAGVTQVRITGSGASGGGGGAGKNATNGTAGGASYFGSYVTMSGGSGGAAATVSQPGTATGGVGASVGGIINVSSDITTYVGGNGNNGSTNGSTSVTVTPGANITVTVGAKGKAGNMGTVSGGTVIRNSSDGADGYVKIDW